LIRNIRRIKAVFPETKGYEVDLSPVVGPVLAREVNHMRLQFTARSGMENTAMLATKNHMVNPFITVDFAVLFRGLLITNFLQGK
jgi:hypothetical protein